MPDLTSTTLTLSQFVKLIDSSALAGYIRQNFTISRDKVQLPFKVTCAFKKLDNTLHNPEWHWMSAPPLDLFNEFLAVLVSNARNNWHSPNVEKTHAEYLLGLLLHLNLQITDGTRTISFKEAMFEQFPLVEANYIRQGILPRKYSFSLPEDGYYFLSENWRKDQDYPSLEELHECWVKNETIKLQQELTLLEQKNQQLKWEAENERRQQELDFQKSHCFLEVLNLEQFSYALEGFIKSEKVRFPSSSQLLNPAPILSASLSAKIVYFAHVARTNNIWPHEKSRIFVELIKEIMEMAKVQHENREACQLLLGFLLYHNFQIYDGQTVYKISDIYWFEASPTERLYMQLGADSIPVTNLTWLQKQRFPGKDTIESILTSSMTSAYLPGYQRALSETHQPMAMTIDERAPVANWMSPAIR